MAANFQQQMGAVGQMMPQQQQQQQQQQRLPQNLNPSSQVQQMIFQSLNQQTGQFTGWQANVLIQERLSRILNIIGNLRLASQQQANAPTLNKMIEIAMKFERDMFEKSPDKATYKHEVQMKLEQLLARRAENQQNLQQSINLQAQAQAQAQAQVQAQQAAQAQQMMLNQNGMQGQGPRAMPQQPGQQGFHHLQHQMQASPLPGQQLQPQQMPIGMSNEGMPQNIAPNPQQQFQIAMQQPQQQPQQPQKVPGRPNGQQQLSPADSAMIMEATQRIIAAASDQEKASIRAGLQGRLDAVTLQRYQAQGVDPLFLYYRNQAVQKLRQEKQALMAQAQAQLSISQQQQPQNIPTTAPPMQQQRSMNPSPLNGQAQPPTSMSSNPDFGSFLGNMGNLIDQQQQGVMAQAEGQMVVPASGVQRNATPQPGVMPGQHMNANDQRAVTNPNARAQQQQQQMFNAQQVQQAQQQRMQQAAQQQSQAAARANAQAKAQQMALQGQPGGMGNGPIPPQQSPAMGTLNTPIRTPSQQANHPDPPQIPNAQFGQPLDPRFMQANQRPGNAMNGSALNAMFAAMPQEHQQRLAGLPQEKLNEVVSKWHEQRAAQMNASNGRPPMPMQGNNQMRPGQLVPQPGQFNPQNAAQFMMANPGQRPPQSMVSGMTPQQQMMLQQQIARLQQNPLQQRIGPSNLMPTEQVPILQMDGVDFPPMLMNHAHMPGGIPPEIKKWGPLKQWAQSNPNLPTDTVERLKSLQLMHYQQILRNKNQLGGPSMGMQPSGQVSMPVVPPGMAAPVAPMGQNPMQVVNGMGPGQMRQPTQLEIQQARNHISGKMAHATDEQIRAVLMRHNHMAQQQQQQRQNQLMQMQMANQMAQGQHGRQGVPLGQAPQNANAMGPAQSVQGQGPQSKQPQPGPDPSASSAAANNSRTTRPPTSARAAPQTSSPAQPPKNNLKRASSDDVVEVPNPNTQQPPRSAPSHPQGQMPVSQQPRTLTPQQIAALDPEARKRYENTLQMWRATRAPQANAADMLKLRGIMTEEDQRARENLPDVPMDADTKANMIVLLREILQPLNNVHKAVPKWFQITHDESRARIFFRTRHRLAKQFQDSEMTRPKDVFSIRPAEVEQARLMLSGMVKDLSDRFPEMKKGDSTQAHPAAPSQPTAPASQPPAATSVPLTAASLQQQQQQLNKMHQRSASRSSQTPAAPTSTHPPFQFGASSPHGAPAYIGKTTVTQENLHIPARKKQKQNNTGNNTPGPHPPPQVNKAPSPEVKRQPAPESKPQQKPPLCCSEPECDRHNVGFESEEALRLHTQEEHIQPLENPAKYAQENLASLLGLDSQGRPKNQTASTNPEAGAKMAASGSRQGQTPNMKGENASGAATPMNGQTSMNRQASTTGAKPSALSKSKVQSDSAKDALAKLQADQKESVKQAAAIDHWANATIDPHDLCQNFQGFESGAGGAISDMNVYRSITPNDTPESSKDGISEPNSDISEGVGLDINLDIFDDNWMPFGPSDTDLLDLSSFNMNGEEDMVIFDEGKRAPNYQSWDDMLDPSVFDKPFSFDTSMYSMNAD